MKRRSSAVCGEGRVSPTVKRTKVQAQRKFAQGSSNYTYSATKIIPKTPESVFPPFQNGQQSSSPETEECELNNFSSLPTVDDFLTFLCFRETDVLPERLNYLNNPQFDVLPAKKKTLKSNTVTQSIDSQRNDQGKNLNRKSKYDLKNKKNAEYKLRSRIAAGKNIVTKTSRSLALKHNQRLRSKSVVHAKAKICESKLQNLIIKPTLPSKLKPYVVPKSILKPEKGRPSTRALEKDVSKPEKRECKNSKRVTRRNLLLEKSSERPSPPSKDVPGKKSASIKSPANFGIKEMSVCLHNSQVENLKKTSARSQRISLPKVKSSVTNVLASDKTSSKPTTRSTRSGSSHTEEALPSPNVSSRPSRRTKEAAALYMEMLGKELLCPEESFDDDDNVSIESFPELPNTEQHIRREKELKEMNRKKILEKTPSRKTSTPKAKPFVKPSESCLPPKVPRDSVKEKTVKESVKVSESMKTTKDPSKHEDAKTVKDSAKMAEPVKTSKESSKTSSEHVKTTQQSTKVPEKVEVNEPSKTVVLEKIILVAKSDSAKKQGLCTRSKQYNEPAMSVRSEQSAKTIRTRGRSEHLGRRNSYNDVYDKSKRVNHFLARESRRRSAKLISFVEFSSGESDFLSEEDDTPVSTNVSVKPAPEMLKNSDLKNSVHREPKTAAKGDKKRVLSTRKKKRDHSVERRKSCSDVLEKSTKSLDKDSNHRRSVKSTDSASTNPSKTAKLINASKANGTSHHDSAKPPDSGPKKSVDSNRYKNENPVDSGSRDSVIEKVEVDMDVCSSSSGSPFLSELFNEPKAPAPERRPNSKSTKTDDKLAVQTALPSNKASNSKSKDVKKNEESKSEDSEDDYKPISMHLSKPPTTVAIGKNFGLKTKPTAENDIQAAMRFAEPSVFRGFSPPSRKTKTEESESNDSEDDYKPISRIRESLIKAAKAAALKDGSNFKSIESGDEPAIQAAVSSNKASSLKSKGKKKEEREPQQSVDSKHVNNRPWPSKLQETVAVCKNVDLKKPDQQVNCPKTKAVKEDTKDLLKTQAKRDRSIEARKSSGEVCKKPTKLEKDFCQPKIVKLDSFVGRSRGMKLVDSASKECPDPVLRESTKPVESAEKTVPTVKNAKLCNSSAEKKAGKVAKVDENNSSTVGNATNSRSISQSVPEAVTNDKKPPLGKQLAAVENKSAAQNTVSNLRKCNLKGKNGSKKYQKSDPDDSDGDDEPLSTNVFVPKSAPVVVIVKKNAALKKTALPTSCTKSKTTAKKKPAVPIQKNLVEKRNSSLGKPKSVDEDADCGKNAEPVDFAVTSRSKGAKMIGSDPEGSLDSLKIDDAQLVASSSEKLADSSQIERADAVDSGFEKSPELVEMASEGVNSSSSVSPSTSEGVTTSDESDFKKPMQERQFFARPKTAKNVDKPVIQTAVLSTSKVFNLESKKIFKKNASPVAAEQKEELSPRKSEAFSADNENSVYAFEPDLPTTSPPFRRLKPVTPPKQIAGNSIAVQVSFENDSKLQCSTAEAATSSSTDCCGDRVFYIPIQTSSTTSTLGVAVKLDTDGSNQKIIMSATLITNSPTCTTNTATTVSAKTLDVGATCAQTETIKLPSDEQAAKKLIVDSAKIGCSPESEPTPSGVTTSAAAKTSKRTPSVTKTSNTQSVRIVKLSKNKKGGLNSKTKTPVPDCSKMKKPTPEPVNPEKLEEPAVVKMKSRPVGSEPVSLEAVKVKSRPASSGSAKPEAVKPKARPAKNKNAKKPTQEFQSGADERSSMPVGDILEAPTFYPTEEEFNDPLEYIDKIRSVAEKFGLCRIVPPSNFRPECKVVDDMRFTAYNQYVHKMLHRWGPNVKEMMAIKKYLATLNITFTHPPLIGGMEVDLPHLYQIVQQCGGLKAVIERERWQMVADIMKIPKLAHDRITKLDDIYCKYLLPYDILSHDEREKLFEEIEREWMAHLQSSSEDEVFDDIDECIVKGRTMPLSCFYRIARNTMMTCFGNAEGQKGPSTEKIEEEFWNHVSKRKSHMCVHCGSIDSGTHGYGFSVAKNSTFRKHPWNLKVLTNNTASILRFLGPVMGVTVPTLHVGMLYSACCWYRDPHGLPWIEYLHTGANKIWYGIPDDHSEQFKEGMLLLVPRYCRDKRIWLPSDTVMIPPPLLTAQNISLSRVVQHPGQFIVVFPKAFTSSISTGYLVSESVYFAHAEWLDSAKQVFMDMQDSCEPSVFSLEQLVISIAEDSRPSVSILAKVLLLLLDLKDTELAFRSQLKKLGLNTVEKLNVNKKRKSKGAVYEEDSYECETCHTNLFVSLVVNAHEQCHYCLRHAVALLSKKPTQVKHCTLMYSYTEEELHELVDKVKARIEAKSSKKSHGK